MQVVVIGLKSEARNASPMLPVSPPVIASCLIDPLDVVVEVTVEQVPIVQVFMREWGMLGEANFRQATSGGLGGVLFVRAAAHQLCGRSQCFRHPLGRDS